MTCWSCGGGIPDGSNFCGLCGARQNPTDRITRSGWMRARDARLGLPSSPPVSEPEPDDGRVTQINPAVLVEGAPEPVTLVLPDSASPLEPRPRFAALAAAGRPSPASLIQRLAEPPVSVAPAAAEPSEITGEIEGEDGPPPAKDVPLRDTVLDVPTVSEPAAPEERTQRPATDIRFTDRPPEVRRARPPVGVLIAGAASLGLLVWWLFQ